MRLSSNGMPSLLPIHYFLKSLGIILSVWLALSSVVTWALSYFSTSTSLYLLSFDSYRFNWFNAFILRLSNYLWFSMSSLTYFSILAFFWSFTIFSFTSSFSASFFCVFKIYISRCREETCPTSIVLMSSTVIFLRELLLSKMAFIYLFSSFFKVYSLSMTC